MGFQLAGLGVGSGGGGGGQRGESSNPMSPRMN